jgi:L-amino acid N-acyltransferase YncA
VTPTPGTRDVDGVDVPAVRVHEARAYRVRDGVVADLTRVAEIYNEQVARGVATFDTEPKRAEDFEGRLVGDPTCPFLVAEETDPEGAAGPEVGARGDSGRDGPRAGGLVVGYAWAGWFRPRPAYAGTRETSIYLDPGVRGRGIGRRLYGELLARLDVAGVHTQVAVIARPNEPSEALHVALGFVHVGTLAEVGHKFGRYVDTAWYQRMAGPPVDGGTPNRRHHSQPDG